VKCNLCDRTDNLGDHPHGPQLKLCPDHQPKPKSVQKSGPAASAAEGCYRVNKAELKALRMDGLLSLKAYVYMALMIDYPAGADKIDMKAFCMKWGVPAHEMLQALGQLAKNGLVNIRAQDIVVDVLTRDQRKDALKGVLNAR
jgi:hypothetical protein